MLFNEHDSYFYYFEFEQQSISDYYNYIVNLIKQFLKDNQHLKINIILNTWDREIIYDFANKNKLITININYEHTLVKIGGRGADNAPIGNVISENNTPYLVRIDRYSSLKSSDIVIDYSIPNIHNVQSSNKFNDFPKNHIYIAPTLYSVHISKSAKNLTTLTSFINTEEPRRKRLLEQLNQMNLGHINIHNCFDKQVLRTFYNRAKILINIHQTDHHHTLEELRVLPALQCGVLVISERSPLNNLVPYNEFIIWSEYDTICDKVIEVVNNYDYFFDLIFKKNDVTKLTELDTTNYNTISKTILSFGGQ